MTTLSPRSDGGVVLLVEDDETVAMALRCGLVRAGHPVERVRGVAQALERLETHDIALVLLDGSTAGRGGDDPVGSIVARHPGQPLLVMEHPRVSGGKVGATSVTHLLMPFALGDLLSHVRALVGPRPSRMPASRRAPAFAQVPQKVV